MKGTLKEMLLKRKADFREKAEPGWLETMAAATEALRASGQAEQAIGVGDVAPDFTLPRVDGDPVTLADVLTHGPAILSFYRGRW